MARHKDVNWNLNENLTVDVATVAVLMDIRDELKQLNLIISCENFLRIPGNLEAIRKASNRLDKRQAQKDAVPTQQIIDMYHRMLCPPLPRMVKRTKAREAAIRARWREYPDLANFKAFFEHVLASDFLLGKAKGRDNRPFRASLDWLMKDDNFAKVLEGKYAD